MPTARLEGAGTTGITGLIVVIVPGVEITGRLWAAGRGWGVASGGKSCNPEGTGVCGFAWSLEPWPTTGLGAANVPIGGGASAF